MDARRNYVIFYFVFLGLDELPNKTVTGLLAKSYKIQLYSRPRLDDPVHTPR